MVQSLENMIVRRHDIEEAKAAGTIEDRFAVSGAANHDRLLGRSFQGENIGAIERYSQRIDIIQTVALVQAGVNQDDVAGLRLALVDFVPVAETGAIVGGVQAEK